MTKKEEQWYSLLIEIWGTENKPGAEFNVDEIVEVLVVPFSQEIQQYKGFKGKILAMNFVGGESGFEYIVEGYPLLVWENGIRGVE